MADRDTAMINFRLNLSKREVIISTFPYLYVQKYKVVIVFNLLVTINKYH